jgi:hypothetical protein
VDPSTDLRPLQQTLRRRTYSLLPSWRETQRCLNPTCPPMPAMGRPCAFDSMTIAPSQRGDDGRVCYAPTTRWKSDNMRRMGSYPSDSLKGNNACGAISLWAYASTAPSSVA